MKLNCNDFTKKFQTTSPQSRILLDVRNPDEVQEGALIGHVNIPLPVLENRANELSKDKIIFVYCRSGGRAQKASEILAAQGFTKVEVAVGCGYSELKETFK